MMDINDLTNGQDNELTGLFGSRSNETDNIYDRYIGQYVIVRSRNEGVNAGFVVAADSTGVILSNVRRLWKHRPKDSSMNWYEGVAQSGLSADSKISTPATEKAIVEDYSITVCSDVAQKSIIEFDND